MNLVVPPIRNHEERVNSLEEIAQHCVVAVNISQTFAINLQIKMEENLVLKPR